MKKNLILFLFILSFFSCNRTPKAKDIVIDKIITPCDCVSSFLLVVSEINDLNAKKESLDSSKYLNEKGILESIMNSVDQKCIIYEGSDNNIQSCDDYEDLLTQMQIYGIE